MELKNAKRIKNILDGNFTGKTSISVGYKKRIVERAEGDVWEEDGKEWIFKDGIKQSLTKTESVKIPLTCPECGNIMKKQKDKTVYQKFNFCLDCLIEKDTKKIIDGTFTAYQKDYIEKNFTSWVEEMEVLVRDYLKNQKVQFVTEDGTMEEWKGGKIEEETKEEILNTLSELKEQFGTEKIKEN